MNEYFVEDEYSFYEIDPECRIEYTNGVQKKEPFRRLAAEEYEVLTADGCRVDKKCDMAQKRSSQFHGPCCSCLLWYLVLLNYGLR